VKTVIAIVLIGIVVSLGQALFAMTSGPDQSGRVVKALTVRIGLSLALFVALMVGWHLGLIEPLGAR
jgi:hypothetical protein